MIPSRKVLLIAATMAIGSPALAQNEFRACLQIIGADAARQGVPAGVIDSAFRNLTPDQKVVELDSRQPEFSLTYGRYIANAVTPDRIAKGQQKLQQHRGLLEALE